MDSRGTVRVAIVQARPPSGQLEAGVDRLCAQIAEAASKGARVIACGETFLPGYPAWLDVCPGAALWDHEPTQAVYERYRRNSLVVPSEHTERIGAAAKAAGAVVVVGASERIATGPGQGTLYNTMLIFTPDGTLARHHRKLIPTFTERLVWGNGDAAGLEPVRTTIEGVGTVSVGGLVCWEHWMPGARQALHDAGEDIHIALWPTAHEMHQIASRHYAFEGRCFVLAVGQIMPASDLPGELDRGNLADDQLVLRGGSSIIAPDGSFVTEPRPDEETIIIADLDLGCIDRGAMALDVSGHYARPDVFDLRINRTRPGEGPRPQPE